MEISASMLLDAAAPFRDAGSTGLTSPLPGGAATDDVGQQFESIFVSMLLKEMRQTASDDGLFAGDNADVYGGMFDMFLGQHIASQGAFGIAELLNSRLELDSGDAPPAQSETTPVTSG